MQVEEDAVNVGSLRNPCMGTMVCRRWLDVLPSSQSGLAWFGSLNMHSTSSYYVVLALEPPTSLWPARFRTNGALGSNENGTDQNLD